MIGSVADFARYFDGVRRRTWGAVDRVGPELLGWAPRPGEMTCGEIVRHLDGGTVGMEPPQIYGWRMEDVLARVAHESEQPEEPR